MGYREVPLEKRLKENIRNYRLENLYEVQQMREQLKCLEQLTGIQVLVTERHGEKMISVGNFADFKPDVVNEPGRKLRVENRTVGHVYSRLDKVESDKAELAERFLEELVVMWERLGQESYEGRERAMYIDEMESRQEQGRTVLQGSKEDVLTGVLNKTFFEERVKVLDRSEVVPLAALEANINDWKFVNDHYGVEESDRLIRVIAEQIRSCAREEYVIGRVDGDVFRIVIPLPEEDEVEDYVNQIKLSCEEYEDEILSPSIAVGVMMKTNVEEKLNDVFAEAEYKMFEDKFEMKQDSAYQARLHRNI